VLNVTGITNNQALKDINGLENLTTGYFLRIIDNPSLLDFCGLQNPSFDFQFIEISGNAFNPTLSEITNGNCSNL
jgi:hypothetical protein